ncbi:MAG: hypothetical protein ACK4N5_18605 [Myxococcales bacterium]
MPPQPSATSPHAAPASSQLFGLQPHTFSCPLPPQVAGAWQLPHCTRRISPQASAALTWPQFFCTRAHSSASVSGQPHCPALPPAPHTSGSAQPPQFTLRDMSQLSKSTTGPHCRPMRAQKARSVSGTHPPPPASAPPPPPASASSPASTSLPASAKSAGTSTGSMQAERATAKRTSARFIEDSGGGAAGDSVARRPPA